MTWRKMFALAGVVAAGTLGLAGCSDDDDEGICVHRECDSDDDQVTVAPLHQLLKNRYQVLCR